MWLLLMVLLSDVSGFDKIIKLQTFGTEEECQTERNRIGFEMAEAYPYERDFIIVCQPPTRKVTAWATSEQEHSAS